MFFKKISLLLCCAPVFANPGSYTVICHAAPPSQINFSIKRMNDVNWKAPEFSLSINKKKYILASPDSSKSYGQTIKDLPLGLLYITVSNDSNNKQNNYDLELKAIPSSIKSDRKIKWSLNQENNQCYDQNGDASFQGILSGRIVSKTKVTELKATLLNCTIEYDSGMAC